MPMKSSETMEPLNPSEMRRRQTLIEKIVGYREFMQLDTYRHALAEAWGTFVLVFVAIGAIIALEVPDWEVSGPLQIGLCFGLGVAVAVWMIGHISGGHINPAVSFAFLVTGGISLTRFGFFVVAQCVGSLIACTVLRVFLPGTYFAYLPSNLNSTVLKNVTVRITTFGVTMPSTKMMASVSVFDAIIIEAVITAILVFTVFASVDKKRHDQFGASPLMIGLSVAFCHLFAIPVTGSSMNPARSFGPAVFAGIWNFHYVYWIGPLLGGAFAGLFYKIVLGRKWQCRSSRHMEREMTLTNMGGPNLGIGSGNGVGHLEGETGFGPEHEHGIEKGEKIKLQMNDELQIVQTMQ